MGGAFVVVGEAFAAVPDFVHAAGNLTPMPSAGRRFRRRSGSLAVSGPQRIRGEQSQDIGQHQLLVLLLVVDAHLDQAKRFFWNAAGQQRIQIFVHIGAVRPHLFRRRPR